MPVRMRLFNVCPTDMLELIRHAQAAQQGEQQP